ncbi:MAG: hypothetical protein ACLPXT_01490 [Terracidiphilus sp.]
MVQQTRRVLNLLLCITAFCGSLCAQTEKTITIRMLDSKSGKLIATSSFLVRINHQQTVHGNWVLQNEDGTGKLTVPGDAALLSVRATYDSSTSVYANCDANKDTGSSYQGPSLDRWYEISDILANGVMAPNHCIGKKVPNHPQVFAKPGEFVFFVRKQNWREQMREDYTSH